MPTIVPLGAVTAVAADAPLPTRIPVRDAVMSDPFSVVVLVLAVEPTVMAVVEPDRPPVPMLTVLVLPEVVAPLESVSVVLAVDVPNELFAPVAVILPPE